MNILDLAKADIEAITSDDNGWTRQMTFVAPNNVASATINGLHSKHHTGISTEGMRVSAKTASVSVSEKFLSDKNYPVRDADGEVLLKGHLVAVKDSTGNFCIYSVREWYPDETVGLIVCILGDFDGTWNADSTLWTADTTSITADSQ